MFDGNDRARAVWDWKRDMLNDPAFVYLVYKELDKAGLFPPGMRRLDVERQPATVKLAASVPYEGPTAAEIIKKVCRAYDRAVEGKWGRDGE